MTEAMQQSKEQVQMNNQPFVTDTAMELRLSVREPIFEIYKYLTGKMTIPVYDPDLGEYKHVEKSFGNPKANDEGIHSLMMFVNSVINTATVQGNFDINQYSDYIADKRDELRRMIVVNSYKWKIPDNYLSMITDTIMAFIEPFISRTIGDGERGSYRDTMRLTETSKVSGEQFARWDYVVF